MSVKSSKILVPVGFSDQSITALDQACSFAKLDNAKLFLLSVLEERSAMDSLFLTPQEPTILTKWIEENCEETTKHT